MLHASAPATVCVFARVPHVFPGSQPINVFWIHDNQEILPQDVDYTLVTNGDVHKLVVNRMHKQDSGEYVCEAYNDFGDTDTFCRLQVRGRLPWQHKNIRETRLMR